ncbi:MAG: hypothetical protein H6Q72_4379 [Firmicutes bacterium]|nr:hypothetical protein [Bacillota bacterium]
MKYSLMMEECPKCKKTAVITYREGLDGFKKCKECDYQEKLSPEADKGCCNCC